jgi:uncharacterized protein (TIGR02679 family)
VPADGVSDALARLARPGLAPIVDELARRLAEGSDPTRLTLRDLPLSSRQAIADLLGMDRLPGHDFRLAADRLRESLNLDAAETLRVLVERLRGPLPDRPAERAAGRSARADLWSWLDQEVAALDLGTGPGRLAAWVTAVRAAGVRGGIELRRRRLERAVAVLRALPGNGDSLASFANDHTGDSHALDHGSSLSTLVLDAVAVAVAQPRPIGAEAARSLWESVGVVPDPLSSTVLALGIPGGNGTALRRWLRDAASAGEPVVLTLAQLRRWPVAALPAGTQVYVVENPSLVVEASSGRWDGPPVVCSSGRPTVATITLLRALTARGAQALQHADFDPAGLSITAWLSRHAGTIPWRMGAADYAAQMGRSSAPVTEPVPPTPWDPALQGLMERERKAVYEEQVRADLLTAMRQATFVAGTQH